MDNEAQNIVIFFYHPGQESLADYVSKAHTAAVHRHVRSYYIHEHNSPRFLAHAPIPSTRRGCVKSVQGNYIGKLPLPILRPNIPRTNRVRATAVQ